VVEGEATDVREKRLEGRPVDGVAADRERAERVAVEAALEGDEPAPARVLARGLEGALDRLGAARGEVHDLERRAEERREALREAYLRLEDELAVDHRMEVALGLGADRGDNRGMRVSDVRDPHAGEEVQVWPAGVVPDGRARGARHRDAERCARRLADVTVEEGPEV